MSTGIKIDPIFFSFAINADMLFILSQVEFDLLAPDYQACKKDS